MTTTVAGSTSGAIFEAINNSYTAYNTYGLEGIVANAPGGIGILGYGNNTSVGNYGVYGSVLGPNGTGVYGYAQYPAPSGTPNPSTASTGVIGLSLNGFGVIGQTKFPNSSNLVSNPVAGVWGADLANPGNSNIGVLGTTTNGGYGVAGESSDGAGGGVLGYATTGTGVFATSNSGYGVWASSAGTDALVALGPGVGRPSLPGPNAIYAENNDSSVAPIYAQQDGSGAIFQAVSSNGGSIIVDNAGNVTITGKLYTSGSCSSGCVAGRRVMEYTPRTSLPTMEDVGEAQLVAGTAYVRIDPAFANVIDRRASYLVFITPEGDSNSLYVTNKTPAGFVVRESHGGRSTLAFQYRIVAKPYDITAARLPMVRMSLPQAGYARHIPAPLAQPALSPKMARFLAELRAHPKPHLMPVQGPNPYIH